MSELAGFCRKYLAASRRVNSAYADFCANQNSDYCALHYLEQTARLAAIADCIHLASKSEGNRLMHSEWRTKIRYKLAPK